MEHLGQLKSAARLGKPRLVSIGVVATLGMSSLLGACGKSEQPPETAPGAEPSVDSAPEPPPSSTKQAQSPVHSPQETQSAPIATTLPASFDCSGLTCYRFSEARQALLPLVIDRKAHVVAFGEAHAPTSFKGRTTVRRFTEDLLPTISGGSSHLLLELLLPPDGGCEQERAQAQKESDTITEGQAGTNQNEYLTLGKEARRLGVVPDILRATCDDLARIAAPDGGVLAMMETIANSSSKMLLEQLAATKEGRPLVLAYGGALHNDATPREGRETWSYGPRLIDATKGSYLEIDLLVPELIGGSESWKSFGWYEAYKNLEPSSDAILMKWGERSYSLFFPPEPQPASD